MDNEKRIIFFGFSDTGYKCLKYLLEEGLNVVAIFTHDADPHENRWFESVEALGKEFGIKVYKPSTLKTEKWARKIKYMRPDLILSVYYRNLIPVEVFSCASLGAYNMHGSYLPTYRGRAPLNWAIINGENYGGASLHVMEKSFDTGDIVAQEKVIFGDDEYVGDIQPRITIAALEALKKALPSILEGNPSLTKQDESKVSYYGKRTPEDGKIDFAQTARQVYNMVRALSKPFPGAFAENVGDWSKLIIWRAYIGEKCPKGVKPATVIHPQNPGEPIKIACADNFLLVHDKDIETRF